MAISRVKQVLVGFAVLSAVLLAIAGLWILNYGLLLLNTPSDLGVIGGVFSIITAFLIFSIVVYFIPKAIIRRIS